VFEPRVKEAAQEPIRLVPGALSRVVKRQGREAVPPLPADDVIYKMKDETEVWRREFREDWFSGM
jgi:hypothetical protein